MRSTFQPLKYLLVAVAVTFSLPALAIDAFNTTRFGNVAIEGYDPVAYFTENKPVKGSKKLEYKWMDAKWRFSSEENLKKFQENPEQFAPQYGGYCAWAVSQGYTASIDPDQFTVLNDKLYLNYNKKINTRWTADRDNFIKAADKNWPELLKE